MTALTEHTIDAQRMLAARKPTLVFLVVVLLIGYVAFAAGVTLGIDHLTFSGLCLILASMPGSAIVFAFRSGYVLRPSFDRKSPLRWRNKQENPDGFRSSLFFYALFAVPLGFLGIVHLVGIELVKPKREYAMEPAGPEVLAIVIALLIAALISLFLVLHLCKAEVTFREPYFLVDRRWTVAGRVWCAVCWICALASALVLLLSPMLAD